MAEYMRRNDEKMDKYKQKVNTLDKKFTKLKDEQISDTQKEANELLADHLEHLKHSIDASYEGLMDWGPPRELDDTNNKDKGIMNTMIKIIDGLIESINPSDDNQSAEDEDGEDEEEEDDQEEETEEEDDESMEDESAEEDEKEEDDEESDHNKDRAERWKQYYLAQANGYGGNF